MDQHRLIDLLTGKGSADAMCREALHHGADFTITDRAMPASHLARIYERRERYWRQHGITSMATYRQEEHLRRLAHSLRKKWPVNVYETQLADIVTTEESPK